jgi:hypothetical protein
VIVKIVAYQFILYLSFLLFSALIDSYRLQSVWQIMLAVIVLVLSVANEGWYIYSLKLVVCWMSVITTAFIFD